MTLASVVQYLYGFDFKLVSYHNNIVFGPFFALVLAVSGITVVITLSAILTRFTLFVRVFTTFGQNSLVFLASHIFIIWFFRKVIENESLVIIVTVFSLIPLMIAASYIIKRNHQYLFLKVLLG